MPSVATFLSLLGAAALAGVQLAPVEKEDHVEEMVTRCIVEVLLNGLSKSNAPPINPQCRELLKKNNQPKQEKENGGKDLELDSKAVPELEERQTSHEGTAREEQGLKEDEFKRQAGGEETWLPEGKPHGGTSNLQDSAQGDPWIEAHNKERKKEDDKRTEGDGDNKRNGHSEEGTKEKKHSEDGRHGGKDKKSLSLAEKEVEDDYKRSEGQRYLEEIVHSQEERDEESKEDEDAEEEEEKKKKRRKAVKNTTIVFIKNMKTLLRGKRLNQRNKATRQGITIGNQGWAVPLNTGDIIMMRRRTPLWSRVRKNVNSGTKGATIPNIILRQSVIPRRKKTLMRCMALRKWRGRVGLKSIRTDGSTAERTLRKRT
ncbi:hypothetical protein JRQ81_005787 [Phrynocephalus forsythii]|uniref:Uncharacterized protein n=1 Tax=Phrynocephalus forsythii TaxID=171643 RepID=A0A9Q0Y489_9SAUR|nr:hypothetical protein JRQ81_005787 [Phrynocephalus forsythii]